MVTRSLKWVCITALLLVVLLRSSASHQLSVDFLVCAGAFTVVLALISENTRIGLPTVPITRSDLGPANHCKAVSVVILSTTVNASETPMPDTIKAETTLIEEDALMAESLRFESEPWTRFYMAGEIIRESRKASGKQSKYGSEGDMDHSDKVIDHYDHPCDVGSLPKDDPNGSIGPGRRA